MTKRIFWDDLTDEQKVEFDRRSRADTIRKAETHIPGLMRYLRERVAGVEYADVSLEMAKQIEKAARRLVEVTTTIERGE